MTTIRRRCQRGEGDAAESFTGNRAGAGHHPQTTVLVLTNYASRKMKSIFLRPAAFADELRSPRKSACQILPARFAAFVDRNGVDEVDAPRHLPTTQARP